METGGGYLDGKGNCDIFRSVCVGALYYTPQVVLLQLSSYNIACKLICSGPKESNPFSVCLKSIFVQPNLFLLYRAISEDGQHFMVMHFEISNVPMSIFIMQQWWRVQRSVFLLFVLRNSMTFIEVVECEVIFPPLPTIIPVFILRNHLNRYGSYVRDLNTFCLKVWTFQNNLFSFILKVVEEGCHSVSSPNVPAIVSCFFFKFVFHFYQQ